MQEELTIPTSKKQELIDITTNIGHLVRKSGIKSGICSVLAAHATAAIIINENYDPNICVDLLNALGKLIPKGIWLHDKIDGNADAHIKSAILGASESLPITDNALNLGRWQSLMLAELDGPRKRKIVVTIIGDRD